MKWLDAVIPAKAERSLSMPYGSWQWSSGPDIQTTWNGLKADPLGNEFADYVENGLKANGVIWALALKRFSVFSEMTFQFASRSNGNLFGNDSLSILEHPFPGGTTGDLLTRMLLEADFAGNSYRIRLGDEIVTLRPDWVEIILGDRPNPFGDQYGSLGFEKLGYLYYHGGKASGVEPIILRAEDVCHFAPYPDPNAAWRGMSWLTPVAREIIADGLMTDHKRKFMENSATPNLHVRWPERLKEENFRKAKEVFNEFQQGPENAGRTLFTDGGADVTVLGKDFQQMDFKAVQGAGETRLASAAGVPAVIAGFSEGMQGSSLNAGNYTSAKRNFADTTMANLWRNVAGSFETIVPPPPNSKLWYNTRDVAFLRDDSQDRANIQQTNSITIRNYTDAGFTPDSAVAATVAEDETLLVHSGLFSVQLQPADSGSPDAPDPAN